MIAINVGVPDQLLHDSERKKKPVYQLQLLTSLILNTEINSDKHNTFKQ